MVQNLTISVVQSDIVWEDVGANLAWVESAVMALEPTAGAALVVLPEMFATGFSMNPGRIAQPFDSSEIVERMTALAHRCGRAVVFSAAISEGSDHFNRLYFITPGAK